MKARSRTRFLEDELQLPVCSVAAAIVGSAVAGVAGSAIASSGAKKAGAQQAAAATQAAEAQLQATRESNALALQQYRQNLALAAPQLQAGQMAQSAILRGLGLGGLTAVQAQPATTDEYGNVIGPVEAYGATQEQLDQAARILRPGQLTAGMPADFTMDPSYQFRLQQGLKALQASASARGGLLTGQAGVDLQRYGQEAASQEYGAAFERHRATQSDLYNRLASLAGLAPQTATNLGTLGSTYAQQVGTNLLTGAGRASDYLTSGASALGQAGVASAGAWNQGLANIGGNLAYLAGRQLSQPAPAYYPATQAAMAGQVYGPMPYGG